MHDGQLDVTLRQLDVTLVLSQANNSLLTTGAKSEKSISARTSTSDEGDRDDNPSTISSDSEMKMPQ